MTEINPNNQTYSTGTGTPLYNYADYNTYQTPSGQTVNISAPNSAAQVVTSPIYQYPTASLYNSGSSSSGIQGASGVNIHIYNPSAIGGQQSSGCPVPTAKEQSAIESAPIANTPISEETSVPETPVKTKNVVDLTDDYIKTLESYLRSDDKSVRKMGIQDLVKRFEEDDSRYDDEALTALLNIALQDSDAGNRLLAMSPVAASVAHGNDDTINLLQNLTKSDKMYGQEAKMATDALLKASQQQKEIVDNSPEQKTGDDENNEEDEKT